MADEQVKCLRHEAEKNQNHRQCIEAETIFYTQQNIMTPASKVENDITALPVEMQLDQNREKAMCCPVSPPCSMSNPFQTTLTESLCSSAVRMISLRDCQEDEYRFQVYRYVCREFELNDDRRKRKKQKNKERKKRKKEKKKKNTEADFDSASFAVGSVKTYLCDNAVGLLSLRDCQDAENLFYQQHSTKLKEVQKSLVEHDGNDSNEPTNEQDGDQSPCYIDFDIDGAYDVRTVGGSQTSSAKKQEANSSVQSYPLVGDTNIPEQATKSRSVVDKGIETIRIITINKGSQTRETEETSPLYSDEESQTSGIFEQCCKCNVYALPLSEQFSMRLKNEITQRLTLEQLCKIVEQESRDMRMQYIAEQNKCSQLHTSMQDLKGELSRERHLAADYKTRNDELKQALEGSYSMISKLEEQVQSTNPFKGGIDYLLESKLATSKATEAQTKVEALQNELVQSRQEVQHLLQRLSEVNRDRSEMVSSSVHQELLAISDERAKHAELKVLQLENEVRQMKRDATSGLGKPTIKPPVKPLSVKQQPPKPTPLHSTTSSKPKYTATPPEAHGASKVISGHTDITSISSHSKMPIIPSHTSSSTPMSAGQGLITGMLASHKNAPSIYVSSTPELKGTSNLPSLPDFEELNKPASATSDTVAHSQPLFVTSDSEDSDWSSDEDTSVHHSVTSIKRQWERMSGGTEHLDKNIHPTPSPKSSRPPIASKPKLLLPKPMLTPKPAKQASENIYIDCTSVEESSTSFEKRPDKNQLKIITRVKGATGRRKPSRGKLRQ